MKLYKIYSKWTILSRECPISAKMLTENGSHLEFLILRHDVIAFIRSYNITIGFSDLDNVDVDTKFVFLSWPKT